MVRRLGLYLVMLGALAIVPGASAAYPGPYSVQGGDGVLSNDGSLHFIAFGVGESTLIRANKSSDGTTVMSRTIAGAYGVPTITTTGPGEGMFRDGSTFVLQSTGWHASTQFLFLRTQDLSTSAQVNLNGTFAFDALSPSGTMLYLIQHRTVQDVQHYVVRAYDLSARKLLPGRIADKTQKSWIMQGLPVTRISSTDGRFVYTLYYNPGGYPFIHALDTVRGVAHCVGLPVTASEQNGLGNVVLALHGKRLAVHWRSGRPWLNVDLASWRVTPAGGGGLPWLWIALGLGLGAALLLLLRRIVLPKGTLSARAA